ncbi:hypothetical protein V6Z93_000048 [Aspergillus fumigatus]
MQALSKQVQTLSFLLGTPLIKTSIVIIPDTSGSESASLYPTAELQRDFPTARIIRFGCVDSQVCAEELIQLRAENQSRPIVFLACSSNLYRFETMIPVPSLCKQWETILKHTIDTNTQLQAFRLLPKLRYESVNMVFGPSGVDLTVDGEPTPHLLNVITTYDAYSGTIRGTLQQWLRNHETQPLCSRGNAQRPFRARQNGKMDFNGTVSGQNVVRGLNAENISLVFK